MKTRMRSGEQAWPLRLRSCVRLAVIAFTLAAPTPGRAQLVAVELTDGRTIEGQLDAKTDDERLWLRRELPGIRLQSGFAWIDVDCVYQGEELLDRAAISARIVPPALSYPNSSAATALEIQRTPSIEQVQAAKADVHAHLPRIATLVIQSRLAQWDEDLQPDGLRVRILPLDAGGQIVPVRGQVELKLEGYAAAHVPRDGLSARFVILERASAQLEPSDFAHGPAEVRLPFSHFRPDRDSHIAPEALLTARLNVPGVGAFEASDDCLLLRDVSWMRDQLQYATGARYRPSEN